MTITTRVTRRLARLAVAVIFFGTLAVSARADGLTLVFDNPNQTATVGTGSFTVVTFTGSVTNNSTSPITFQLLGGPVPFEPYVSAFVSGVPYPGETLAPGQSTGTIDLAIVTLQMFDPSLTYPGFVNIVLPAVDPRTGATIAPGNASIEVLQAAPEPSAMLLLVLGLGIFALMRAIAQI